MGSTEGWTPSNSPPPILEKISSYPATTNVSLKKNFLILVYWFYITFMKCQPYLNNFIKAM